MTPAPVSDAKAAPLILVLDEDVIARTAVAIYLRECGYAVIEASAEPDAKKMLEAGKYDIDIVICATSDLRSADAFTFSRWVRAAHPNVRVLLAATIEKTARLASDICEEGPHLRKPYDHQALLDWIKRLRK
jgi:CheY-like chemotaxis protein